jgi:hypothetical protein
MSSRNAAPSPVVAVIREPASCWNANCLSLCLVHRATPTQRRRRHRRCTTSLEATCGYTRSLLECQEARSAAARGASPCPRVTSHPVFGSPDHKQSSHRQHAEWAPSRVPSSARKLAAATHALCCAILAERPHPRQGFRSCLGILRLAVGYGDARVESAWATVCCSSGALVSKCTSLCFGCGRDARVDRTARRCVGTVWRAAPVRSRVGEDEDVASGSRGDTARAAGRSPRDRRHRQILLSSANHRAGKPEGFRGSFVTHSPPGLPSPRVPFDDADLGSKATGRPA